MLTRVTHDERGAAAVEFALTVPIVFLFIYGIFQVGAIFAANAVMQSALGEGARYATVWPAHTDSEVQAKIQSEVFDVYKGDFAVIAPVTTTTAATSTAPAVKKSVLSITYTITPDFMLFQGPQLVFTRTKTAYISTDVAT